jgi:hypothetical protein
MGVAVAPLLGILLALLLLAPWVSVAHAATGSSVVPVGPRAPLAPSGNVLQFGAAQSLLRPNATQNPGTGMSTDFDWATLVLEDGGWPTSSNNVTVITQWMASENCIPTTSTCPYPWWNRNNPLNNGLGSGGGDGTGSYENLVIAAYYVALNLEASNYGYPQIAADLAASAAPSTTATAIEDSDWAASHYGYGSGWHSSAVESIAAPESAWGNGGGREPNGSFIKVVGAPAIYRVIGGAPVHVDSCAPLGGCPGLVEVPSLDGYATEPESGAFIRMANGPVAGLVARVVGGVPLGLTTCEGMESEGCNDAINLDEGGFNEYAAAHKVVANGTFVRIADGPKDGLIGRVVGGVLLGLTTCEGMEGEGCNTAVNVAENAYDYYASEYHTIANGTFVRVADGPKAGLIGRVVGGVLFGLVTCEGMEGEGCNTAVNVAENAYLYYAEEYDTIANGTFVRVADGPRAGLIGRVVGDVLLGLATCEGMESEGCDNAVNVAENAYLYYASEYSTIANGTFVRIADGPKAGLIARAAGGALLGLTSCVALEECSGQVNVAENAFIYYTTEHPQPANGTLVEGVPSDTYWLFTNGEREPASAGAGAVAIDDGGLAFYPIKAPSSGNLGAGSTGTGMTSTTGASTDGGSTTSSPGKGGVLASHTAKPLTRAERLAKAVRACDKLRSKHRRTVCIAAARRRYHQPKSALPGVIAGWQGGYVVRPRELALTPTDGEYFAGAGGVWPHSQPIDWTSWTKTEAVGKGALWVDVCGCSREGNVPYPGTVRAFDVRGGNFTQLTIKTIYLNGPMKIGMSYKPGERGAYRFENNPRPVTDRQTSQRSALTLPETALQPLASVARGSLAAPSAGATRSAHCNAASLFKAAEAGQHFNTRSGYEGDVRPGASEVVCDAGWAVALISHPNVGTTDGNTLFRSVDDRWRYVGELGGSVAICQMRRYHVPKQVALKLAHGHEHSGTAGC